MGSLRRPFNLTLGNGRLAYQDVMCLPFDTAQCADVYSIPSTRGSHSDISGT